METMDQVDQKRHFTKVNALLLIFASILSLCVTANAQQDLASKSKSHNGGKDVKTAQAPVVPPQYIVGEGDLLRISVWKEAEISQNVVVRPDGMISLPLISDLRVSGLTPEQIQGQVTEKLKAVLTNPQITVTVLEVHSKEVYITGEVGKPGAYQALAPMNVLQLIARAGGLSEFANRKAIYIFRASDPKTRLRFNYKEVVSGHRPEQNIILQPGDTVVVP
jgi:polysaccharide biosynthesis/export protein